MTEFPCTASPTLQRAEELLRALMATVGDLSVLVGQTNAMQAKNTQNMHAVADFLANKPH